MILSDRTMKRMIASGELVVSPLTPESIQPASLDCRLGDNFKIVDQFEMSVITLDQPIVYREAKAEKITIQPHSFALGTTVEYFELPDNIVGIVHGRSSIGRAGLFTENAGLIDPGFKGQITLELFNGNSVPIVLNAGWRVCQVMFCFMDQPVENPYAGKYQGQQGTVGSRIFEDADASRIVRIKL